ncbi:hypothetical protein ACQ9LF_08990 [Anaerohalosphaeraceae bacterium U12dextr]
MIGVDPAPLTLRELWWMSQAIEYRDRMEWNRISALMSLLCNINRDPKRGKVSIPTDFNPYAQNETKTKRREDVIEVKDDQSKALFKAAVTGQA